MVTNLTISDACVEGQRIDNFLMSKFRKVPKARIYRAIRKGEVRVNKGRISPLYKIKLKDQIRIPPLKVPEELTKVVPFWDKSVIDALLLYEDERVLVINKPVAMPVHGGSDHAYGLIDILRQYSPKVELAHRLDKSTSGCLLLSKCPQMLRELTSGFAKGTIEKHYLALVQGQMKENARVELPLRKTGGKNKQEQVEVDFEQGAQAITDFSVIKVLEDATLVLVSPLTGRTHQIRAHAKAIGHPIAGDGKYGDRQFNAKLKKEGLSRLYLHAIKLGLPSFREFKAHSVIAPLEATLRDWNERREINEQCIARACERAKKSKTMGDII